MYTDAILALIGKRPGIRAVEIADQVDCEVEAVERSIKEQIDAGNVRREIVTAPNGRPTCAFWMKDALAAPAEKPVVEKKLAVEQKSVPVPVPPAPAAQPAPKVEKGEAKVPESVPETPASSPPPLVASAAPAAPAAKTKVEILMDYIRNKPDQTATDDELREVIGLRKDQHPSTFLSTQRRRGEIHKDIDVWRLGARKTIAQPAVHVPTIDQDAEFRCALWSDGELQLARGEQIALRLTATEVAQLCNYLLTSRAAA
jgi:hypothetical protein